MLSRRNAHGNGQHRDGLPDVDELAVRYGFRRVERVHIRTVDGATVATVIGVVHRYPRSVRVPLRVASRLVEAGARLTVERAERPPGAAPVQPARRGSWY